MSKFICLGALVSSLILAALCPTSAFACRGAIPTFGENVGRAHAIFEGVITSVTDMKPSSDTTTFGHREYTFKTSRWWKGRPQPVVIVRTDRSSCGFRGEVGSRWVILAGGEPLSTWLLGGNIWLRLSDGKPTGNSVDAVVKELGLGEAVAP